MSRIAFPPADAALADAVEAHLRAAVAGLRRRWADAPGHVGLLLDGLDQAVSGGKRLRAAILLTAFEACASGQDATSALADVARLPADVARVPADDDAAGVPTDAAASLAADAAPAPFEVGPGLTPDAAAGLAAAVEMFHASALVHDDLLDNSPTRRGRPAAHVAFSTAHTNSGWLGEAVAVGAAGAILLGDLALIETQRLLHGALTGAPGGLAESITAAVDEMAEGVVVGQYLDTLAPHLPLPADPTELHPQAMTILRDKSARYSVEFPLVLGAMAAGVARSDCDRLAQAGLALGEAFQLRDDLLGSFGDPDQTGKPAHGDLAEGKRTVLVACALGRLQPAPARELSDLLTARQRDAGAIGRMAQLIETSGAIDEVENMIAQRRRLGLDLLGAARMSAAGRKKLVDLAHGLTDRQR